MNELTINKQCSKLKVWCFKMPNIFILPPLAPIKTETMRKLVILIILTSLTFFYTYGQVWVEDDAVWHYDFYVSGSGFYKVELGTDTLIQNKNCQKYLITKYTFFQQQGGVYIQGPIIDLPTEYTYTSGDTVFYYKNDKFYTLFNFSANVGDKWIINDEPIPFPSCDSISRVEVIDTREIEINGVSRRTILLHTIESSPMGIDGWIVENIGPIGSQYLFPTGRNCNDSTVICFEQHSFKCYQDSLIGLFNPSGIDCEYLLNHVGTVENKNQIFQVYPNPTSDFINIEFRKPGKYQLTLFDHNGKIIISVKLSKKKEKINLIGLPNGVYTLGIETDKRIITTEKIIKK